MARIMSAFLRSLRMRPRLLFALGVAIIAAFALPGTWGWTTRILVAWDISAVLYLALVAAWMAKASIDQIKKRAAAQDEGAGAVLLVSILAAVASLAAIGAELAGISSLPAPQRNFHAALAAVTIVCSWFLVQIFFTLHYAHEFYGDEGERGGLLFPREKEPDYFDFLYFAFNLGCASQTSDVQVISRRLRRTVLGHTILSFFFNTSVLALGINVGASLL